MKKIFFATLIVLALNSVAAAQSYRFLSMTDLGAWAFVDKMVIDIYEPLNGNVPVVFSEPTRRPQLTVPQNFPRMSVWASNFSLSGETCGEIRFYVSSKGHVFAVQIFDTNNPQVSTAVLVKALQIVGLSGREIDIILRKRTAEVWCSMLNCRIVKKIFQPKSILLFAAQ